MKVDARPGGYVATGGHGGILGGMGTYGVPSCIMCRRLKHTYQSEVNLSKIPSAVPVARATGRSHRTHRNQNQGRERRYV